MYRKRMQKVVPVGAALLMLAAGAGPVRGGPVGDLVAQAQQLHAQATMLSASPQLSQQYSSWASQYEALIAAMNAQLPYANNGEYQVPVTGRLQDLGGYYGSCPTGSYWWYGGYGCEMNLQLQAGAFVLLYYQQMLVGDNAMLQQVLQNASAQP